MNEPTTGNRTAEMIKWLANHPGIQRMLCQDEYESGADEFLEILDALEKQGYYEMIYIFLMKNQCHRVVGNAIDKWFTELLADAWAKAGNQQICREMKERIQNEMAVS